MKTTKSKQPITRIPRPKGFTSTCISYNTNKTIQLGTLRNLTIQHYLSSQFLIPTRVDHPTKKLPTEKQLRTKQIQYELRRATIEDLSTMLMLKVEKTELRVTRYLAKQAEKMQQDGVLDNISGHSRAFIFGQFLKSLHRHQRLLGWEEDLMAASKATYHKPGYSASANTAISLTTSHEAHVLKIMQSLSPNQGPNPNPIHIHNTQIQGQSQAQLQGQEILTPDKAVALLAEAKVTDLPLENRDQAFIDLVAKHNLDDMPNVTANFNDAQGVSKKRDFTYITHEDRRADEVGDSLEAID